MLGGISTGGTAIGSELDPQQLVIAPSAVRAVPTRASLMVFLMLFFLLLYAGIALFLTILFGRSFGRKFPKNLCWYPSNQNMISKTFSNHRSARDGHIVPKSHSGINDSMAPNPAVIADRNGASNFYSFSSKSKVQWVCCGKNSNFGTDETVLAYDHFADIQDREIKVCVKIVTEKNI